MRALALLLLASATFWLCLITHPLETTVAYAVLLAGVGGAAFLLRDRVVLPRARVVRR